LAALAGEYHRLRVVEDTREGNAAEGVEGGEERPDECLDLLVGDELDVDPAGPLESAREEMEEFLGAVVVADPHVAEVILAELADEALEADEGRSHDWTHASDESVDRVLARRVSTSSEAMENLDGR
jgi:urease accessory protein UreH